MHMRGREMRRRLVPSLLEEKANPLEYIAYAIDTERTLQSAQAYFTGLFPSGQLGPAPLTQAQIDIAVPPVAVEDL